MKQWLAGHQEAVVALGWSPDGKWLASVSSNRKVRLWGSDGQRAAITNLEGQAESFSWSPDSTQFAIAGGNEFVVANLRGEGLTIDLQSGVYEVAWSPDGRRLAVIVEQGVRMMRPDNTDSVLITTSARPHSLSWKADSSSVAYVDGAVYVADAASGETKIYGSGIEGAHTIDWCPTRDSLVVAYGSEIGEFTTAGLSRSIHLSGPVYEIAWNDQGNSVLWGSQNNELGTWNLETGQLRRLDYPLLNAHVESASWHPNGDEFVSSGGDGRRLRRWNVDGTHLSVVRRQDSLSHPTWSSTGSLAYLAGNRVEIWSEDKDSQVISHTASDTVCWSPDGTRLAASENSEFVRIWDSATGTWKRFEERHEPNVRSLVWTPKGLLASCDNAGVIRVWSKDDELQFQLRAENLPHELAVDPNSELLAAVSDSALRIWNLADRTARDFDGESRVAHSIALSSDGTLASGHHSGHVRTWHRTGQLAAVFPKVLPMTYFSLTFRPGTRSLLISGPDSTISLWDADSTTAEWFALDFNAAGTATFSGAGKLIDGDAELVHRAVVYLVQTDTGVRQLSHREFQLKYGRLLPDVIRSARKRETVTRAPPSQ